MRVTLEVDNFFSSQNQRSYSCIAKFRFGLIPVAVETGRNNKPTIVLIKPKTVSIQSFLG